MGSRVTFVRAPRGDATQAPPPIGASGQLGTSARAAREDHTHEGVHMLVAGSGISVDPASGLGDVKVEALHWRPPVATAADLPATGNQDGDARVVLEETSIYIWTGTSWQKVTSTTGGSGGGGGGASLDLVSRINHLIGQIRVSHIHNAPRFDLYSEFIDDFNGYEGILSGSDGFTISNSKLSASGSLEWSKAQPAVVPPARYDHAMAYDSGRGVVVLFGGIGSSTFNDTWEWDGTDWVQRTPATVPAARYDHAMAYDSNRGVVVMFGGSSGSSETWEWDGTNWVKRTPATSPPARFGHAMTYDAKRRVVVMFGGLSTSYSYLNDTWEWDGTDWVQRTPATSPSLRANHAMTYDERRGVVVMFGGNYSSYLNDTWEWDGTDWVQRTPATSPPARSYHAMAYDSNRGVVVMFGGSSGSSETWEWDGTNWVKRTPATVPAARYHHAMAYDDRRGMVVLFGGIGGSSLNDTWLYAQSGSAIVTLKPLSLPWVPVVGYVAYIGSAKAIALSRDGGNSWTYVPENYTSVDLSTQPPGQLLTARIELEGAQFIDAIGVGASNI